jgi:hypothetical protein
MYPLGHIGITVFLSILLYLPAQFSAIGVLLPDIADKVLYVSGLSPSAHFIGHTILFGLIAGLITFVVTKRKDVSLAILFGCIIHLIEDVGSFIPWVYPFVNYTFTPGPLIVITTYTILNEILGGILLIISIVFNSKLIFYRERIHSWLKKSMN